MLKRKLFRVGSFLPLFLKNLTANRKLDNLLFNKSEVGIVTWEKWFSFTILLKQIISLVTLSVDFTCIKKVRGNDPTGEMIPALSYFSAHWLRGTTVNSPFYFCKFNKNKHVKKLPATDNYLFQFFYNSFKLNYLQCIESMISLLSWQLEIPFLCEVAI